VDSVGKRQHAIFMHGIEVDALQIDVVKAGKGAIQIKLKIVPAKVERLSSFSGSVELPKAIDAESAVRAWRVRKTVPAGRNISEALV
jgi:hypothetical protein